MIERFARWGGAIGPAFGGDIRLETENRLDPGVAASLVKLQDAVHIAVIGQRQGRHAERLGSVDQRVDLAGAVEEGLVRVDVQMDKWDRVVAA